MSSWEEVILLQNNIQFKTTAATCFTQFDRTLKRLYQGEQYMRLPTKEDLTEIVNLHKNVHGVMGYLGRWIAAIPTERIVLHHGRVNSKVKKRNHVWL